MNHSNTYCGAPDCNRPILNSTLCTGCLTELANLLSQADWVIDQLRVSRTRQQRFSKTTGPKSTGETPVLFNARAADAQADYAAVIALWQARTADHFGLPVRYPNPIAAAAWTWTAINTRGISTFVDAGHMLRDIESAHREALKVINKAPERWFAGTCSAPHLEGQECPQDLYASSDTGCLTCSLCGTEHDIAVRRQVLLVAAEATNATATEAARAIVVLSDYERGENKLVKRIGTWFTRGRIAQRGTIRQDGQDRPLYRIGDILDLLAADHKDTDRKSA